MLLSFIVLNLILAGAAEPFYDDVLFDIQNQNRFNHHLFGPPPIFQVKKFFFFRNNFFRDFCSKGRSTYSIWICKRYKL
jgi:hypothetical protein